MTRPTFSSSLALGACLAIAVAACFIYIGGLSLQTLGVSALCGAAAIILRALLRLPSPVVGLIVALVPAVVIPDAFFIGLGFIFIVGSVLTAALFSVAHTVVVKASKRL